MLSRRECFEIQSSSIEAIAGPIRIRNLYIVLGERQAISGSGRILWYDFYTSSKFTAAVSTHLSKKFGGDDIIVLGMIHIYNGLDKIASVYSAKN